ncbi:MAG: Lrp/AsnC family transcriptional regulator [Candidatus Odinarchaeota archaeon]
MLESLSKPPKIDAKDKTIISLLEKNPKMSHQQIADELKVARQTVQKRIQKLEDNGVIKYCVLTNDKILGKEITAFILVEINRTHIEGAFHQEILSRKDELDLLEIHYVAGQEDLILKMRTTDIDSFGVNLIKISEMRGVARTRTIISLYSVENFIDTIPSSEFL